ncbi:hypothetical protein [Collimonas fungivorans]|uniref:hypothetical protein n=1 Tax=Collimonas fungivorans TaxID=158899 RepID=UPI003CC809F3
MDTNAPVILNCVALLNTARNLSVIHSDLYVDVPHFAGKFGVERIDRANGAHAAILRPAYFMGNDTTIKDGAPFVLIATLFPR